MIRTELATAMFERIEAFHNPLRRHPGLDYRSPIEFEALPVPVAAVEERSWRARSTGSCRPVARPRPVVETFLPVFRQAFRAHQDALPVQNSSGRVAVLGPVTSAATSLETLNFLCLGLLLETPPLSDGTVERLRQAAEALGQDNLGTNELEWRPSSSTDDGPFVDLVVIEADHLIATLRDARRLA